MMRSEDGIDVLVIEDNLGDQALVRASLARQPHEFRVVFEQRLANAIARLDASGNRDYLVLLDLNLPDSAGLATLATLREAHPRVPVVVLTGTTDEAIGLQALRDGAQEFLGKDELMGRSLARVIRFASERYRLQAIIEQTALVDPLTDVYNRRGFELSVLPRLSAAKRSGSESTVLYADLDGLKGINDLHGHQAGDTALRAAAAVLKSTLRTSDLVARIGGDEFAVWMDGARLGILRQLCERVDAALRARSIAAGWPMSASLSIGATIARPGESDIDALLERADRSMYAGRAVRAG